MRVHEAAATSRCAHYICGKQTFVHLNVVIRFRYSSFPVTRLVEMSSVQYRDVVPSWILPDSSTLCLLITNYQPCVSCASCRSTRYRRASPPWQQPDISSTGTKYMSAQVCSVVHSVVMRGWAGTVPQACRHSAPVQNALYALTVACWLLSNSSVE